MVYPLPLDERTEVIRRVETLYELGRYQEAAALLGREVARAPDDDNLWYMLSRVYTDLNQPAEALSAARRAVELAPEDSFHHVELGVTLWNTRVAGHDFDGSLPMMWQAAQAALEAVQHALQLNPFHSGARMVLADFYLNLDDPAEAKTLLLGVLKSQPHHAGARLELARVAMRYRSLDVAEEHIEAVLAAHPHSTEGLSSYALLKLRQGKSNQAFEMMLGALQLDPTNTRLQRKFENMIQEYFPSPYEGRNFVVSVEVGNIYRFFKLQTNVRKIIRQTERRNRDTTVFWAEVKPIFYRFYNLLFLWLVISLLCIGISDKNTIDFILESAFWSTISILGLFSIQNLIQAFSKPLKSR